MILQGLRTLVRGYPRILPFHQSINHIKKYSPGSLLQTARSYATYCEDEEDDFSTGRKSGSNGRRQNKSAYAGRYSNSGRGGGGNRGSRGDDGGRYNRIDHRDSGALLQPQRGQKEDLIVHPIDWSNRELSEFDKNFYKESEATTNRSEEEVAAFRKQHNITVPRGARKPILTFEELNGLPQSILKNISGAKFSECTPIQAQGMPFALSGQNMVGVAQTGSGKTLAYIAPALVHILHQAPAKDGPIALVIAPTRELAIQINEVASIYSRDSGITSAVVYGGSSRGQQMDALAKRPSLVIATPGRLIDLLSSYCIQLHRCTYFVLDEADRMLDMGFEPQVRQIESQIRPDRQTLMWSATWPPAIRQLASDFLGSDYINLNVGSDELSVNPDVTQIVHVCTEHEKFQIFSKVLEQIQAEADDDRKTLIFTQTKRDANILAYNLQNNGTSAEAIHGDKTQIQRDKIIQDFRSGDLQILIATDVASRGLDVNNIKHVINYDFPNSIADYVHRVGRTGRAGRKGTAYTLFKHSNVENAAELVDVLERAGQKVDHKLKSLCDSSRRRNKKNKSSQPKSIL